MNPPATFSVLQCQKIVSSSWNDFFNSTTKIRDLKNGEVFGSVNVQNARMRDPSTFVSVDETLYPYSGKIGIKKYNPPNLQSMDCYKEVYTMPNFHIRILRYRAIINLAVLIMNIMLQELMSIRNI